MTVFRHSRKDAWFVGLCLLTLGLQVSGCLLWNSGHPGAAVALALFVSFLICTNYQCISHNFIHNPFFDAAWANRLFSLVNSIALGFSQTIYKHHHLNHHQYNNDAKDPATGSTQDYTSIYRHARADGRAEGLFTYSFVGVWRSHLSIYYSMAVKRREHGRVWLEVAALVSFFLALGYLAPVYTAFVLLPAWYLGQALALAENYMEHYGANPYDTRANSVSCYDWFYNFVWFNNGYHQEHHYRPSVHWTLIPRHRLEAGTRRIVRYWHVSALFHRPLPWRKPDSD